jgi:hypothetical protein
MRASLKIFVASMLVALAVAMPAAAQTNATQKAYTLRAGVTETSIQGNQPSSAQAQAPKQVNATKSSGGGLPFTGLQLSVVLGVGIVLLGAGLGMRRLARPTQAS